MIETLSSRRDVHARVAAWRRAGLTVGFVPTMGALHEGHLSLCRASKAVCDRTVASIFVNPLQFGPNEDLARYPRPLERDRALLASVGADALYLPATEEMYPPDARTTVSQTGAADRLCGAFRPGHFAGVATVVAKLFQQVRPDRAFFGRKDYQQTVVLRRMVRDLDFDLDLEIRVEPTVREPDGLALSSRNVYLTPDERRRAPAIKAGLDAACAAFAAGVRDPAALAARVRATLDAAGGFELQYAELCDPDDLAPRVDAARPGDVLLVAAFLGRTRLIDNETLR